MKSGLTVVFTVLASTGLARTETKNSLDVGVKPNNYGSEILGMDQLVDATAQVRWDPVAKSGDIYE